MNDQIKTEQPNEAHISPSELNAGLAMRNKKLHEFLSRAVVLLCEEPDPTEYADFMDEVQAVLTENIVAMDDKTVIGLDG